MAQFYAWMQGARGAATRLGHKTSGIRTCTKSYAGQVAVEMWHSSADDTDRVRVTLEPHGGDSGRSVVLYHGPCDGWRTYHDRHPVDELGKMVWDVEHGRRPSVVVNAREAGQQEEAA